MSPKAKAILIGGIIAVPVIGYAYYKYVVTHYDYNLSDVQVINFNGQNSTIQITIDVKSTIGIAFTITDVYFDIYLQGYKIGNVTQQGNVTVPNFGYTQLVLTANVDLSMVTGNIVNVAYNALQGNNLNLSMVGYTHVKVGAMPFTTNVALQLGYNLNLSNFSIS